MTNPPVVGPQLNTSLACPRLIKAALRHAALYAFSRFFRSGDSKVKNYLYWKLFNWNVYWASTGLS